VAGDGDALLLPVTLRGKEYLFLLDTGSAVTTYDVSLPLGQPRRRVRAETPNGDTVVELFEAPQALLGKLDFRVGPQVMGADLSKLRQVTGYEMSGVIGMDFLSQHVVRIDFDSGRVVFLRSAGANPGHPIPLSLQKEGPCVDVRLPGLERPERFLVDTGSSGFGRMKRDLGEELARTAKARKVRETLTATLSETKSQARWQIESLSLGNFEHRHVVLTESRDNILGLDSWSRYAVTFDFPRGTMYLKKGGRFDNPGNLDMSSLHLLRVQGETVVHSVDAGSPAAASGIRPKDVLVKVTGGRAEEMRLFSLRRLLCSQGKELQLTIKRGGDEFEVTMVLGKWPLIETN
jgi:hypothetical protein